MKLHRLTAVGLFFIGGAMHIEANANEVYVLIPFYGQCIKYSKMVEMLGNRPSCNGKPSCKQMINKALTPTSPRHAADIEAKAKEVGVESKDKKYSAYEVSAGEYLKDLYQVSKEDSVEFSARLKERKLDSEQLAYVDSYASGGVSSVYVYVTKQFCEAFPEDELKGMRQLFE